MASSYQKLSKENKDLIEEKNSLLNKISDLKSEIIDLQSSLERIQISSSLENSNKDNVLAQKKINMFLREIDKCITLLNN